MEVTLDGLIRSVQARADEPLAQLAAASQTAAELDDLGDSLLNHFVDRCRRSGHTWAEIGEHLGVTRQAAQKRFVASVGDTVTFELFTVRARHALDRTLDVARGLQHNYVGTEHVLLALFDDEDALSRKVLDRLGVDRAAVEAAVLERIGRGARPVDGQEVPWTPRARKVLEETLRVAIELGHNYVGTEHLLLGLYRGQDGLAKQVLEGLGAGGDAAKAVVIELLAGYRTG
jgi:hypothetical protein